MHNSTFWWLLLLSCCFSFVAAETAQSILNKAMSADRNNNERLALKYYLEAYKTDPNAFDAVNHASLGTLLAQSNQIQPALTHLQQAVRMGVADKIEHSQLYYNLGHLYQQLDKHKEAADAFDRAVQLHPDSFPALMSGAWSLNRIGNIPLAAGYLQRAATLNPKHPVVHVAYGEVLNNLMRWTEAIDEYSKAAAITPKNPDIYISLGQTYLNLEENVLAASSFRKALGISPKHGEAVCGLWLASINNADWYQLDKLYLQVEAAVNVSLLMTSQAGRERPSPLSPYHALFTPMPGYLRRQLSEQFSKMVAKQTRPAFSSIKFKAASLDANAPMINIGYISRRIKHYAGTLLMMGVFGSHNRSRFHVSCFATGPDDGSEARKRVQRDVNAFYDMSMVGTGEIAASINHKQIHVLIDYDGCHSHNNLAVLSLRAAPVQITWLGFAGTVGDASVVDYIIGDSVVIPPEYAGGYSEHLLVLPHCYQPRDRYQQVSAHIQTRELQQLPPSPAFVFSSFNRIEKLEPSMWKLWMNILNRTSDHASVLWLLGAGKNFTKNLEKEARKLGIDSSRIIFAKKEKTEDHLRRHELANLCLDTRYYNAHTTASDALVMGVPIVTLCGTEFASRVAASILLSMDLSELVTNSLNEYVDVAAQIPKSTRLQKQLRDKILGQADSFDANRFTQDLDKILTMTMEATQMTKQPFHIIAAKQKKQS